MRKNYYRYEQLSEEAKKQALLNVYQYENEDVTRRNPFEVEDAAGMEVLFINRMEEIGIEASYVEFDIPHNAMPSSFHHEITDKFFKDKLDEADYAMWKDIETHAAGTQYLLFDRASGEKRFEIIYSEAEWLPDDESMMAFIMKYASNEEMKQKYRLPQLLENELSEEESEEAIVDFSTVTDEAIERIENKLNPLFVELEEQLTKELAVALKKLYQPEFYRRTFSNPNTARARNYCFDEKGEFIKKEDGVTAMNYFEVRTQQEELQ